MVPQEPITLPLTQIRTDGGTQPRAQLDLAVIADYAEAMADGATFPLITVFYDGTDHWLADGFHRLSAAQQLGLADIDADVRQGTLQDAQWHSYSVNQSHGLQRTNKDKQRAVEAALAHPYARRYTDVQIAKHCGVSSHTVGNYRKSIIENFNDTPRLATRNGTTYEMNTAKIGRAPVDINSRAIRDLFDSGERAEMTLMDDRAIRIEVARRMAERNAGVDDGEFYDRDEWTGDELLGIPEVIRLIPNEEEEEEDDDPPSCYGSCIHAVVLHSDYDRFFCQKFQCDYHLQEGWELAPNCEYYTTEPEQPEPMAVHYSSDSPEWYTPRDIIDRAIAVMGDIDLDPCSNSTDPMKANVPAGTHFDQVLDGFNHQWFGRVYMNPPYGDEIADWVARLIWHYDHDYIDEAIALVPARTDTAWFKPLKERFPTCLIDGRLKFLSPNGAKNSAPFPSAVIYLGIESKIDTFEEVFGEIGTVVIKLKQAA